MISDELKNHLRIQAITWGWHFVLALGVAAIGAAIGQSAAYAWGAADVLGWAMWGARATVTPLALWYMLIREPRDTRQHFEEGTDPKWWWILDALLDFAGPVLVAFEAWAIRWPF